MNLAQNKVSMLQFKVAQFKVATRDYLNPIMSDWKFKQKGIIDCYHKVEAKNLNFIRQHKEKILFEEYQGLTDHVADITEYDNVSACVSIILPSSFHGLPRNVR